MDADWDVRTGEWCWGSRRQTTSRTWPGATRTGWASRRRTIACGSFEEARRRYDQASRLAEAADDLDLRLTILNNLAYAEYRAGRSKAAVAAAERLRTVVSTHRMLSYEELDTIACAYLSAGRLEEAEQVLLPVSDVEATQAARTSTRSSCGRGHRPR